MSPTHAQRSKVSNCVDSCHGRLSLVPHTHETRTITNSTSTQSRSASEHCGGRSGGRIVQFGERRRERSRTHFLRKPECHPKQHRRVVATLLDHLVAYCLDMSVEALPREVVDQCSYLARHVSRSRSSTHPQRPPKYRKTTRTTPTQRSESRRLPLDFAATRRPAARRVYRRTRFPAKLVLVSRETTGVATTPTRRSRCCPWRPPQPCE